MKPQAGGLRSEMKFMKTLLCGAALAASSLAVAQPCEAPATATASKASATDAPPAVRLRLELRDSLPAASSETVVSTPSGAGRPVLTLWTDNNHGVEARMSLVAPAPQGALHWMWSAQQGAVVTPAAPHSPATPQARWWFCPTWAGGTSLVRVSYEAPATDAAAFSPARPALRGHISVPLDEWVPLWAPQAEPPRTGGDVVWRSNHAAPLPRLDMRWRRE